MNNFWEKAAARYDELKAKSQAVASVATGASLADKFFEVIEEQSLDMKPEKLKRLLDVAPKEAQALIDFYQKINAKEDELMESLIFKLLAKDAKVSKPDQKKIAEYFGFDVDLEQDS